MELLEVRGPNKLNEVYERCIARKKFDIWVRVKASAKTKGS